ncbi:transposase, IS4 family protein, partial [Candidatus Magnetobacterium bavaricum]
MPIGTMSFIRYKKIGNAEYAYEVDAFWDPIIKKSRQKVKYLGTVIDKNQKIFKKKDKNEKLILDFGDTYLINEFIKQKGIANLLEKVFTEKSDFLKALICYRLSHPSAMAYANIWHEGNISRFLFHEINISSQRISSFFESISDENIQREFFKNYISTFISAKEGIIIDTTALPNQIHFPLSAWGYNDGEIDKQLRFLFVVDKNNSLPIYFRYLPGNIVDISSLNTTIEELSKFGISSSFVLMDAGFFSEDNIKNLYK